jgi:Zn-finger nucleic acid-binding protein
MALAEALHIIDQRWKGVGMPGQGMDAIFILSPRKREIENHEDLFANIFATHPPINKRIAVLLDLAHAGEQDLDSALRKAEARYSKLYASVETPVPSTGNVSGQTSSPLPGMPIPGMPPIPGLPASGSVLPGAGAMGAAAFSSVPAGQGACPRCRLALTPEKYEGFDVQVCPSCRGVLAREMDAMNVLGTREIRFDSRIEEFAEIARKQPKILQTLPFNGVYDELSIFCPACHSSAPRMVRRFVSQQYPVEIDKCRTCARIWFDKDELEVLQCMYEKDHPA